MKQGDTIEIVIESIGGGGEGLARCGGHTVVVPFALTGEKAAAKVVHVKRDGTVFARLKNIEKPSADRVNPPCPFFGECGGCHLMHMSYPAQLNFKRRLVAENLKKIGGLDVEVGETEPSENVTGYRNKVQQPLGFDGKEAFTGFFRTGTHDTVRVKRCLLQQREARQAAEIFCDFANRRKISVYDEKTGKGLLRHFLARYENGQLLATVVVNGSSPLRYVPQHQTRRDYGSATPQSGQKYAEIAIFELFYPHFIFIVDEHGYREKVTKQFRTVRIVIELDCGNT